MALMDPGPMRVVIAATPSRVRLAPGRNPVPATVTGSPVSPRAGEMALTATGNVGTAGVGPAVGATGAPWHPRDVPTSAKRMVTTRRVRKQLDMFALHLTSTIRTKTVGSLREFPGFFQF